MNAKSTRIGIATVIGIVAAAFEIVNITLELIADNLPTSWSDMVWTGLLILSGGFGAYELRDRLWDLAKPTQLRPFLTFGFCVSAIIAFGSDAFALWTVSGKGLLVTVGALIPMLIFGSWRDALEEPPDLFEWTERKRSWVTHVAEQERISLEHAIFLRDNPDAAAIERLPLCVRVRCGI